MKNFIFAVAVVLLLCNAGGCGTTRQNMEMDNQTEDETAVSSPVTDIVTELAGVDWKKGLLSEIPAYTGRGSLIDCIQSDRVGSVEIEQVPSEDLERYATSLNKAGYQGNLTVIEGAELRSGRYHREENGIVVNLVYTGADTGKLSLAVTRAAADEFSDVGEPSVN